MSAGEPRPEEAERRSREQLEEAEERHRLLLSNLPDALVALYDRDLRCVLLQGAILARAGIDPEQFVGRPIRETLPREQVDELLPLIERALDGESGSVEYHSQLSGLTYDARVEPYRLADGTIAGAFAVARDITERVGVERRLARAVEGLEDAQRLARLGSWSWSPATDAAAAWSAEMFRMFGRDPATGGATVEEFLGYVHPDDRQRVGETIARTIAGGPVSSMYFRIVAEDGTERTLHARTRVDEEQHGRYQGSMLDVTDLRAAESEARAAHRRFANAIHNAPIGMILTDLQGRYTEVNEELCKITGRTREELLTTEFMALTHPDDLPRDLELMARLVGGEIDRCEVEKRYVRPSGEIVWVSLQATILHDDEGRPLELLGQVVDITARKRAADALAEAEQRFRTTVEHAPIGVALVALTNEGRWCLTSGNPALTALLGYPTDALRELTLEELVHPADQAALERDLRLLRSHDQARVELELRCVRASGELVWVLLSAAGVPAMVGAGESQAILQLMDIGERKRYEGQLEYLADHDALTGLFNRRRFEEELVKALARAERYGEHGAVLMIDIDGFKFVNDTLGHAYGDELITRIGGILRATVRETDTIARLGGDEFAAVVENVDADQAVAVAGKLVGAVEAQAMAVGEGQRARVTASVGVTLFAPDTGLFAEELVVEADIAMYEAKDAGKNRVAVYARERRSGLRLATRESWVHRLETAARDGRFELLAQPVVGIREQGIPRYELLLRLRGDDGDLIPPGTFLYIAERFDLIQQIDRWVFAEAVRLLSVHTQAGHEIALSVNMSGKTLSDPLLLDDIRAELARTPIPRKRLMVEVTETAAIVNIERARNVARGLRELGCEFALDDFGAGFASFYYLKHLEFDFLKIDGEFVKSLTANVTDQLVVQSVVQIARGLEAQTIAEFVGDQATVERLQALGVDYAQGYHLGRPRPVAEMLPALLSG